MNYNTDISHLRLEKRFCMCGCREHFRVLRGSPQKFAKRWHNTDAVVFDIGVMGRVTPEEKTRMLAEREAAKANGRSIIAKVRGDAA